MGVWTYQCRYKKIIRLKDPRLALIPWIITLADIVCAALLKSERVRLKIAKFGSLQC